MNDGTTIVSYAYKSAISTPSFNPRHSPYSSLILKYSSGTTLEPAVLDEVITGFPDLIINGFLGFFEVDKLVVVAHTAPTHPNPHAKLVIVLIIFNYHFCQFIVYIYYIQ